MAKFTEETLAGWAKPPSDSEESKLANAERMVRDALKNDPDMAKLSYEIFGQGSYANDTNVRLNSDIDINVRLLSTVHVEVPEGTTMENYGYTPSNYMFSEYKQNVFRALSNHFGEKEVENNNKCIKIKGNTYRVQADVVPTFRLDRHWENGVKQLGSWFISNDYQVHTNFATHHIENGKAKNMRTGKRFKRLCRIVKRLRYRMLDENVAVSPNITSFLIECLLYNVPDHIFNMPLSWTERLRQSIVYIYEQTSDPGKVKDWLEVSECLYLFHTTRKWSAADVNEFMITLWNYIVFSQQ
jgi:hypothetical protein